MYPKSIVTYFWEVKNSRRGREGSHTNFRRGMSRSKWWGERRLLGFRLKTKKYRSFSVFSGLGVKELFSVFILWNQSFLCFLGGFLPGSRDKTLFSFPILWPYRVVGHMHVFSKWVSLENFEIGVGYKYKTERRVKKHRREFWFWYFIWPKILIIILNILSHALSSVIVDNQFEWHSSTWNIIMLVALQMSYRITSIRIELRIFTLYKGQSMWLHILHESFIQPGGLRVVISWNVAITNLSYHFLS